MARFDVDYPHVRENADIAAVLAHYNVELQGDGEQRKGLCPFHDDTKPSLNVNVTKNVFKCHACGSGGNIIKLVQLINTSLSNPRLAALQIAEISGIGARPGAEPPTVSAPRLGKTVAKAKPELENVPEADAETAVSKNATLEAVDGKPFNRPLTFKLKLAPVVEGEDTQANQFLEARNIPYERIEELGIGVGQKGSMTNRLAIPVHNKDGDLVAYCGRDIGLLDDPEEPKYKFPDKFQKQLELYRWHVAKEFDQVVVVESFLTVIKHGAVAASCGFGLVSVMGTVISDEQVALLADANPSVLVCFDGDDAGQMGALVVGGLIAKSGLWVKDASYSNNCKPHQENSEVFCRRLGMI